MRRNVLMAVMVFTLLAVRTFFIVQFKPLKDLGYARILCEIVGGRGRIEEVDGKYPLEKAYIQLEKTSDGEYVVEGSFIRLREDREEYGVKTLIERERIEKNSVKRYFERRVHNLLAGESLGIKNFFRGVILGDSTRIHRDLRENFSYTGSAHLLAVSGLHFGLILYLLMKLLERLPIAKGMRHILEFIFLTIYCLGISLGPSSLRAYVMGTILIMSRFFYEGRDMRKALNIAFGIGVLINPTSILETSFQMSYMALFTILYICPKFNSIWTGLLIQIFLTPITLLTFNQLPLLAFLANFILMPLGSLLISLCFTAFLFSFLGIGGIFLPLVRLFYHIFICTLEGIAKIPWLSVKTGWKLTWIEVSMIYVLLLGVVFLPELCYALRRYKKNRREKL